MKSFPTPYTVVPGIGTGWTYIMQGERLAFLSPPGATPYGVEEAQVAIYLFNREQREATLAGSDGWGDSPGAGSEPDFAGPPDPASRARAAGANEVEAGQTEERT